MSSAKHKSEQYTGFQHSPTSTSTPNLYHIFPRKPIHDNSHQDNLSPVGAKQKKSQSSDIENEGSESDSEAHVATPESSPNSSSHLSKNSPGFKTKLENDNSTIIGIIASGFGGLLLIIVVGTVIFSSCSTEPEITLKDLQNLFPLQSEDIWNALESGMEDIKKFNKPSVFLFLHSSETEDTLENFLRNVAKYASCNLNNCGTEAVLLTNDITQSKQALTDYGYLINKYRGELEKKAVMVIRDLDKISGEVAQAFHSMCDEYNPLVKKSVFFFTIQTEKLHSSSSDFKIVEEILRNSWTDLKEDIFQPLITRLSSMIIRISVPNI